ncbi:tyrosine-protein phosphatase 99A [Nephila pilipes]|uniref:Tyrosine-protein phosphatase 99A n=1 Tax=Nephila pilipes TaxID=299642 RepID=A0A8X6QM87_NEPPI|nr:tyrosine-protein phosphatase 99A [Nephila pilipes]
MPAQAIRVPDIPDPAGMPLIMGFTSRSVNLSWAPSVDNHNSPILHYIIHVRVGEMGEWESAMGIMTPDNKTSYHVIGLQPYTVYSFRVMAVNAIGASEPSKESYYMEYTIRNLEIFTQYLISVQVFNPAGHGPAATVAVMTDEGTPSKPLNLTIGKVGDSSVRLRWQEPEFPNGIILGYRVYFQHTALNITEMRKAYNPQPVMDYVLQNLKPFSHYKVWVNAFTWKHEGETSKILEFHTDVQGPSAPYIVNLTCQSLDSLYVQWERPQVFFNRIDYYFVHYRSENNWDFEEIAMASPHERAIDHGMFIPNLTANTMYEVKVRGATRSVIEHSKLFKGQFSEPRKVLLQNKCPMFNGVPYSDSSLSAGMIAGVMCASFALLLAIVSFILWRKYFQAAYYYLDDPLGNRASPQLSETFADDSEYSAIPVNLWSKHVSELHADGDIGFSREYEAIQQATDLDLSSEHSQMTENKNKNRYVNIVAYDHTRVILKPSAGQKKMHDYINANYIDGYNKPAAYVGTQGPLPSTFDDYWRMIWEQRVYIIVMITNLVERGRRKCDMYWPKEGTETYGIIQVRLVEELVMATYTVRTFAIRNTKMKKKLMCERNVYQYHYTNWPDHGVPDHALPVLNFVRKSSNANPPNAGPIIVHCSAGVGRTGTYIVLDAMLRQIQHKQSVNVCGFLKHIRQQRNYLVQTEEQYIFIHDALLEAIESGETEVPIHQFSAYLANLNNPINDSGEKTQTPVEKQFKLVTSFKARDFNVVSALKPCNKGKNRSLNLIPLESYRVHITPKPGTDGSDYINATFLPGFHKLREFIITQHPLPGTIPDFWQMVFDHNSQTVVVLSSVDDKEYPCFWPKKGEEVDHGGFKIKMVDESSQENYMTRDFIMQATQDEYEMTCHIIQFPGWPETCSPQSSVFDLVHVVQNWHVEYQYGPIIVVDKHGGTEAAAFCCLTTLKKQLEYEKCVDVYLDAKLYHMRRPGMWKNQDDLMFLYRAVENIIPSGSSETESALGNATNGHVNVNSNGHAVKLASASSKESAAA